MIGLFTKHPTEVGKTWLKHLFFCLMVCSRLLLSLIAFLIHGVLPFIPIPRLLNLEETSEWLYQKDRKLDSERLP